MADFEFRFKPTREYGGDWRGYFAEYTEQRNQARADAGVTRSALERRLEGVNVIRPSHVPDVVPKAAKTLQARAQRNGFDTVLRKSVTEENVAGETKTREYHIVYGVRAGQAGEVYDKFIAERRDNAWLSFVGFDNDGTHPWDRLKDLTEWMEAHNELSAGGDGLFAEEEQLQEG